LNLSSGNPANHSHGPVFQEIARSIHASLWPAARTVVQEFDRKTERGRPFDRGPGDRAGPDRVLVLMRDITARKRIERDVLNHLKRERQLSEVKSQFITVASHEFRTPLATAVGSVELLERHAGRLTEANGASCSAASAGPCPPDLDHERHAHAQPADSGQMKVTRMEVDLGRFVQDLIHHAKPPISSSTRFVSTDRRTGRRAG